jgi:hypothetical protein
VTRLRVVAMALVVLTACGPDVARQAYIQRHKVDVLYGNPAALKRPAPRPPGANPVNVGFPSFVSPPPAITVDNGAGARQATAPVPPTPIIGACPAAPASAAPVTSADSSVAGTPAPGGYLYRRVGDVSYGGRTFPLAGAVRREVSDITSSGAGPDAVRTFKVAQVEGAIGGADVGVAVRTTTTYQVDPTSPSRPNGVQTTPEEGFAGIKLLEVTTEGPNGTDHFAPASPVRIATLPLLPDAHRWGTDPNDVSEKGTDPLNGAVMQVQHRTVERGTVDACGVVHQTWRVEVQGQFNTGTSTTYFRSVIDVAPQFGGLILRDELVLTDATPTDANGDGVWEFGKPAQFQLATVSTVTSVKPVEAL